MAGSTNIAVWNPTAVNQANDSQYNGDALRTGGAQVGALLPSATLNKVLYQLSTVCAALAAALTNKNYDVLDTSLANLTAVLQNIMTLADMAPYALLASPAFSGSPTAPTPPLGDSSNRVATTAFAAGAQSLQASGYKQLPGGLILQWINGPLDSGSTEVSHTLAFPLAFPNACLACLVSMNISAFSTQCDIWYQTIGWTRTQVTYQKQFPTGGQVDPNLHTNAILFAIGY